MNCSEKHFEEQEAICLENTIDSFFSDFQVGSLLNVAGIRKLRGASPLKVFAAIFRLPFEGKDFYRGIVEQDDLGFSKDAAYVLLDSWFSFPAVIVTLSRHCPLICMLKNMPRVFYKHEGRWYTLGRAVCTVGKTS